MPLTTWAYDVLVDGIYYNLSGTEATVTYKNVFLVSARYAGSVTIPSEITVDSTTYSVTSIGRNAFYRCTDLTSIEIPNSVTNIDYQAFYGCTSLTTIEIPNIVEKDDTGIDPPTAGNNIGNDGKASWFTLEGQRVDAPGKGLYIRRSAAEPTGRKVLVK